MKILIVEDDSNDREILIYLLESRFQTEAKFREAADLKTAFTYLERGDIDCIVLDLTLPDSSGRETFFTLNERYPDIPIVVMTHNQDRSLALDMVQSGAADYLIKNFLNEEEIFTRIVFAIERQRRGIQIPFDKLSSARRLEVERLQKNPDRDTERPYGIETIHMPEVGPKPVAPEPREPSSPGPLVLSKDKEFKPTTISTVADLSQKIQQRIDGAVKLLESSATREKLAAKVLEVLTTEVLAGQDNQPSLKAKIDDLIDRQKQLEDAIGAVVHKVDALIGLMIAAFVLLLFILIATR